MQKLITSQPITCTHTVLVQGIPDGWAEPWNSPVLRFVLDAGKKAVRMCTGWPHAQARAKLRYEARTCGFLWQGQGISYGCRYQEESLAPLCTEAGQISWNDGGACHRKHPPYVQTCAQRPLSRAAGPTAVASEQAASTTLFNGTTLRGSLSVAEGRQRLRIA